MAAVATSYWPADVSEPVLETTVGGVLRAAAAQAPGRLAMVAGVPDPAARRRWTYAELLAEAEQAARALSARFAPGERIAVWAPNLPEWVILEYAAALAGLVLVTVNPAFRPAELAYVLNQSGAAGIFLVPEFRSPMAQFLAEVRPDVPSLREVVYFTDWADFLASAPARAVLPEVRPSDIAQIQYTSGTTGFPKGAELHHRGLTNNARFWAGRIGLQPGEVYVNPMPLFHAAGCGMGVLGAAQWLAVNVPVLAFDPALVLELLEAERGAAFGGAPTMIIAMLGHPDFERRDLSSVRVAVSGGAPVPADLVRRVESRLGVAFSIVFGTTECSPLLTTVRLDASAEDRAGTLGTPLPQTEIQIADPGTGAPVPVGQPGELCARGYLVMRGYHDAPEATAAAIDAEGWYHTGDLASLDGRGYLRIEGRIKDMIIRGGENIYPREIEDALFAHPDVAEAVVVGVPDQTWGEVVAAFVRPVPGQPAPAAEDLRAWCRERLAPYKTPRHWVFTDAFPTTPSGKIQKYKLRDSFTAPQLADLRISASRPCRPGWTGIIMPAHG
ncbi:MAG TPA: AMP-binding protein [Streptosporangiaceae bacterium]|nr:AMP-binding protein [Streptosporangiaceae bacterium]